MHLWRLPTWIYNGFIGLEYQNPSQSRQQNRLVVLNSTLGSTKTPKSALSISSGLVVGREGLVSKESGLNWGSNPQCIKSTNSEVPDDWLWLSSRGYLKSEGFQINCGAWNPEPRSNLRMFPQKDVVPCVFWLYFGNLFSSVFHVPTKWTIHHCTLRPIKRQRRAS